MLLGVKFPLHVTLSRRQGIEGNIRLRLLTTQVMPKKKAKNNKMVDDLDRALRLDGDPVFGPDTREATVNVLVPADLPQRDWGLVLHAELLSSDNKTVLAGTATTVRHWKSNEVPLKLIKVVPGEKPRDEME